MVSKLYIYKIISTFMTSYLHPENNLQHSTYLYSFIFQCWIVELYFWLQFKLSLHPVLQAILFYLVASCLSSNGAFRSIDLILMFWCGTSLSGLLFCLWKTNQYLYVIVILSHYLWQYYGHRLLSRTSCVCQGDLLSTTLFSMFINNLLLGIKRFVHDMLIIILLYADDIVLLVETVHELQTAK